MEPFVPADYTMSTMWKPVLNERDRIINEHEKLLDSHDVQEERQALADYFEALLDPGDYEEISGHKPDWHLRDLGEADAEAAKKLGARLIDLLSIFPNPTVRMFIANGIAREMRWRNPSTWHGDPILPYAWRKPKYN